MQGYAKHVLARFDGVVGFVALKKIEAAPGCGCGGPPAPWYGAGHRTRSSLFHHVDFVVGQGALRNFQAAASHRQRRIGLPWLPTN